jgi:hypothetical protein
LITCERITNNILIGKGGELNKTTKRPIWLSPKKEKKIRLLVLLGGYARRNKTQHTTRERTEERAFAPEEQFFGAGFVHIQPQFYV